MVIAPNGPCGATDGKKTLLGGVGVALMFTRHGIFITALDALEDTSRGGGGRGHSTFSNIQAFSSHRSACFGYGAVVFGGATMVNEGRLRKDLTAEIQEFSTRM